MYNSIKDVVKDADGQVIIGEVNQDATAQNIQQRGTGFINKMLFSYLPELHPSM